MICRAVNPTLCPSQEDVSYRRKLRLFVLNAACCLASYLLYKRHNDRCEPGGKSDSVTFITGFRGTSVCRTVLVFETRGSAVLSLCQAGLLGVLVWGLLGSQEASAGFLRVSCGWCISRMMGYQDS